MIRGLSSVSLLAPVGNVIFMRPKIHFPQLTWQELHFLEMFGIQVIGITAIGKIYSTKCPICIEKTQLRL